MLKEVSAFVRRRAKLKVAYATTQGAAIWGRSEELCREPEDNPLAGQVQLIFTSPPFPLNRKKAYDNLQGDEYVRWLEGLAKPFRTLLRPRGSIVIEVGNAWESGQPTMSTLAMEALLAFKQAGNFSLCQEFIWHNPARLPTPAQWVTVKRIRVKDTFTRLWWLSPTPYPIANNRRVLVPYSDSMLRLLKRKSYNSGLRPSGHRISEATFLKDNGGAIPPNVLCSEAATNVIVGSNTSNDTMYREFCRKNHLPVHPARMPSYLASFFVRLCSRPGDLVLDPFSGSNVTGAEAEHLGRRWVSFEAERKYARSGRGRFARDVKDCLQRKRHQS